MRRRPGRGSRSLTADEAARFLSPVLALLDLPVDDARWASLDAGQRRRRTLDAARYLVTRGAREAPLCLAIEDAHWIDDETEAVLDALVESAPLSRVLILVSYRPEWHHGWASKTYYNQVRVNPLLSAGAGALLDALLGRAPELAAGRQLLIERTEGTFFLEESVRNLVEHHVLAGERGSVPPEEVPCGRVYPRERARRARRAHRSALTRDKHVLQAAAAIGKEVPRRLLAQPLTSPRTSCGPASAGSRSASSCTRSSSTRRSRTPSRTRSPRRSRMPASSGTAGTRCTRAS